MTNTAGEPVVTVCRPVEAPAEVVFRILADPGRHPDLDGSGMLRDGVCDAVVTGVGDVCDAVVTGVGDVFVMR